MRRTLLTSLAAAAWYSLAAAAPVSDHPGSLPLLLGVDRVRAELKLDSLQEAVLDSLRREYKEEARKLANPRPVTPAERLAAEARLATLNERYNRRAFSALNPSQRVELEKIEHGVLGATMLYSPSVQRKLGVTPRQKEQIEAIRARGLTYAGRINRQFEAGRIGMHERLQLLRARRLAQSETLLALLSPGQREAFLALGRGRQAI